MEKRIIAYIKENGPGIAIIFLSVWVFGKVVESNVDVDKNWQDYLDSKKER